MRVALNMISGEENWVLAEPIFDKNGKVLYKEEKLLDTNTIKQLKKYLSSSEKEADLSKVYLTVKFNFKSNNRDQLSINRMKQDCDVEGILPIKLQNKTIDILNQIVRENLSKDVMNVVAECIDEIAKKVHENPEISYSLGQYIEKDNNSNEKKISTPDLANHSLRVAQFSVALADIYNQQIAKNDSNNCIPLKSIGTAALLHDYGYKFKDKKEMEKLAKNASISDSFYKVYPTIPKDLLTKPYNEKYKNFYAYAALKEYLDSSTLSTILLSNEDEKGKISLNIVNNKTNATSMAAKIVFLCNMYDSILFRTIAGSDIFTNNDLTPGVETLENVSAFIESLTLNGSVNETIGHLFLDNIPLYSVGVRVELSDGRYATVVERFKGHDSPRPVVETLVNPPFKSETIDLRKRHDVTIKRIIASNEQLSDKINEITKSQLETMNVTSIQPYMDHFEEEQIEVGEKPKSL